MAKVKKRHHFVSRFLLNNFSNEGMIYVFDKTNREVKEISTKDAAVIKGYYSIDVEGLPEDIFENALSEIEGPVSNIIRGIIDSKKMPSDKEDLEILFLFIASLACRVPAIRNNTTKGISRILRLSGLLTLEHKYEEMVTKIKEENPDEIILSKGELLRFLSDEDSSNIIVSNEMQMISVMTMLEAIYKTLFERKWYIAYITPNKSSKFILSDTPVSLYFKHKSPAFISPGFLVPDTVMTLAISPDTMICSDLEEVPFKSISIKNKTIREQNYISTMLANRYMFFNQNNFNTINKKKEKCKYI